MKLCFPTPILNQHLVVLGKTGAGKSSALRHIVEHLLGEKKRVVIIDPKGDWWGVKSSADGKQSGYPVIAFGDFKNPNASDVPVSDGSGKHVAELIASGNRPCIIGFRGWMTGRMVQFWIDFASTLFNANVGELYLVIDEVHHFAPKGKIQDPQAGKCLHWSNRLMNEGRGIGLTNLIASQRPQKVHNDTLTACETLVAMRVVHKADRDAVEDWIKGCGDAAQGKEVLNALAGMARGQAFVWSPEVKFGPSLLQFPMFETFDSFAPPQLQKRINERSWADVDLTEVRQKLAAVIEKAKAEDPKELRRQIAELQKQIATLNRQGDSRATNPDPVIIQREVATALRIQKQEFEAEGARQRKTIKELRSRMERIGLIVSGGLLEDKIPIAVPQNAVPNRRVMSGNFSIVDPRIGRDPIEIARSVDGSEFQPSKKQQQILDVLAWYESIGIAEPTGIQVGALALIDATSGHWSNVVGPLSSNGLIERGRGTVRLTDAGRVIASVPERIGNLSDYHEVLRARVKRARAAGGKTIEILNAIIAQHGKELTTEEIGRLANIDHTSGHFSNMIGPLSTVGLISRSRGIVRPTEVLFPPGLH